MERQKQKLHSITQNVLKRNYVYKYVTLPNPREVHVFLLLEFLPLIHSPLGLFSTRIFSTGVFLHSGYSPLGLFYTGDYPLEILHCGFFFWILHYSWILHFWLHFSWAWGSTIEYHQTLRAFHLCYKLNVWISLGFTTELFHFWTSLGFTIG